MARPRQAPRHDNTIPSNRQATPRNSQAMARHGKTILSNRRRRHAGSLFILVLPSNANKAKRIHHKTPAYQRLRKMRMYDNKAWARIQGSQPAKQPTPLPDMQPSDDEPHARIVTLFFGDTDTMQRTLAVLCDSNYKQQADTVTQTVLLLLGSPVHVQLTAVGWQPLKGRELTFPYMQMTLDQRMALKTLLDEGAGMWHVYERAMMYRRTGPPVHLKPLPVLEALCTSVMASTAYSDKRVRVAICNILLQRVQASIPIERSVQAALNARLFPPPATASIAGGPPAVK